MVAKPVEVPESWQYGRRPQQGKICEYSHELDALGGYLSDAIDFNKIKRLTRAADSGDLATTLQFFEEMEIKDAHLQGVANTRRQALTGLEWEIVSAAESQRFRGDKVLADEAAAYVDEQLANLESLETGLEHLSQAIGPNLAVAELVWDGIELAKIVPIPRQRLTTDPTNLQVIRVRTVTNHAGIAAETPKFVIHVPHSRTAGGWTRSLSQASAYVYGIKILAIADWAIFNHRFGIPFLHGKHRTGATPEDKTTLKNMLEKSRTGGWLMSSDTIDLAVLESSQRGTAPQKDLVEWCARQQSIVFLGQALTTDTAGGTGTYAAAAVHNLVRQDLLEDDVKTEGRTVREQIVKPLCIYGFPGRTVPYPGFRRALNEQIDRKAEGEIIEIAQRAGVGVPVTWAGERLAIPEPKDGEPVLEPIAANPFAEEGPPM